MSEYIVEMRNITKRFPGIVANDDVTIQIKKGEVYALLGENGAGKSTLIKLILGLLTPDDGDVKLFGTDYAKARSRIGYVSQKSSSFNTDFPATVGEVVQANLFPKKGIFVPYSKKDSIYVDSALEQVGMKEYKNKLIGSLSGGQQQRVFIAAALVHKPELLLMDEPTVGIDAASTKEIMEIIKELNRNGITIIMTNHDTPALLNAANKLLIFCEHGYEEFVTTAELSCERVSDILAGKRVHRHV